jgi:hypothetical protein
MPNPPTVANTLIRVSFTLNSYEDADGNGLPKAMIVRTQYGPEEYGGFKVSRGTAKGEVIVRWIAPDAMDDEIIPEKRDAFLNLYTQILEGAGFTVKRCATTYLSVSRA